MKLSSFQRARPERRGAALMMAFFVLVILIVLLHQISFSTSTSARVERNEATLRSMSATGESVLLQVYDDLKVDGESDAASGGDGAGAAGALGELGGGAEGGAGENQAPSDSREDDWARAKRTELNDLRVRYLVQDENSKFNVLSILTPDELESENAFEQLVRVIEYARKGTLAEIDAGTAREMANAILEFMNRRKDTLLPKPDLITDNPDQSDHGYLLSLREMCAENPELFPTDLFRDYRDENGEVIHSLDSFLTLWSSVTTPEELGEDASDVNQGGGPPPPGDAADEGEDEGGFDPRGEGGEDADPEEALDEADGALDEAGGGGGAPEIRGRINVNTAPLAVLQALVEERDLPYGFWEEALEYRNTPREDVEENEDPPLDEFGEEITIKQIFNSTDDLDLLDAWIDIEPAVQSKLKSFVTTQSEVFSIFVTIRKPTGEEYDEFADGTKEALLEEEEQGQGLVRTIRSVVWRRADDSGEVTIIPLVRWEVLDYVPIEVLDFPDEDDRRRF